MEKCYITNVEVGHIHSEYAFPLFIEFAIDKFKITYLQSVGEYSVSSSLVSVNYDLTNIINIEQLNNYTYDNNANYSNLVTYEKQFNYFTDNILITDVYVKNEYGIEVPAFYRHQFKNADVENVKIILNGEYITSQEFKYDKQYLYHNFKNDDTHIYLVEYSSHNKLYTEVLSSEPVFTNQSYLDRKMNGEFIYKHKTFASQITENGDYKITILYNNFLADDFEKRPFTIKPISSNIETKVSDITTESGWFVDIKASAIKYNNFIYYPMEYFTTKMHFRPYKPFKYVENKQGHVITDRILWIGENIVFNPQYKLHVDITVIDYTGKIKYLLTSDIAKAEYTEYIKENSDVIYYSYGIQSVSNTGYVILKENYKLDETDTIYASYYVNSPYYTFDEINLNTFYNKNMIGKRLFIFIKPITLQEYRDYTVTSTVRYAIVDDHNTIIEHNIDDTFTLQYVDINNIPKITSNNSDYFNRFAIDVIPDDAIINYIQPNWYQKYNENDIVYTQDNKLLQLKRITTTYDSYIVEELIWEELPLSTYTPTDINGMNIYNFLYNFTLAQYKVFEYLNINQEIYYVNNTVNKPYMCLCVASVNDATSKSDYQFIDARIRGGGIKKDMIAALNKFSTGIKNLYDIGLYDGIPIQQDLTGFVDIDNRYIESTTEEFNNNIKIIKDKYVAVAGNLIINKIIEE